MITPQPDLTHAFQRVREEIAMHTGLDDAEQRILTNAAYEILRHASIEGWNIERACGKCLALVRAYAASSVPDAVRVETTAGAQTFTLHRGATTQVIAK
jgi:hypothetical protein